MHRILILEGLLTVFVGVFVPLMLPNDPATARFLSSAEKEFFKRRLENDSGTSGRLETAEKYHKRYLIAALTDWKIYFSVIIYWGNAICSYG